MKKLVSILVITIILSTFCSCENYEIAKTFNEKSVENGFNNYLAGGNMAYCNNTLYFKSYSRQNLGMMEAYKFSDNGKTEMLSNKKQYPFYYVDNFYQYNNQIYSFLEEDNYLSEYDNENCQFTKSNIKANRSNIYYLSRDLIITYKSGKKLNINYKGKDYVIKLELGINHFYPVGDIIYLQNNRGWLYSYNLKTPDKEPQFIDELADDGGMNVFSVCGDYLYYDCDSDNENKPNGLYRFSLKDKSSNLVIDNEVSCVNSLGDNFYFVADGNLYLDNIQNKPEKLTDIKTKSIYIFDNKWIYLDDLEFNVYRVDYKNNIAEKINMN